MLDRNRKFQALAIMSENPYQAPPDSVLSPRSPLRSRGHAAKEGALHGLCFTAKWTSIIVGLLLALPIVVVSWIALSRWWSENAGVDDLMLVALNLVILVGIGILQLFTVIVLFSPLGAAIQAAREAIRFKPGQETGSSPARRAGAIDSETP